MNSSIAGLEPFSRLELATCYSGASDFRRRPALYLRWTLALLAACAPADVGFIGLPIANRTGQPLCQSRNAAARFHPSPIAQTTHRQEAEYSKGLALFDLPAGLADSELRAEVRELTAGELARIPSRYGQPRLVISASVAPGENLPPRMDVSQPATLLVRVDGLFDGQGAVPDRLAVLHLSESSGRWSELSWSLDFPWIRVQPSAGYAGLFIITEDVAGFGGKKGAISCPGIPANVANVKCARPAGRTAAWTERRSRYGDSTVGEPSSGSGGFGSEGQRCANPRRNPHRYPHFHPCAYRYPHP